MKDLPFFDEESQTFIVAKLCRCGHLEQEHGSLLVPIRDTGQSMRLPGEGSCCAGRCACKRFTYDRYVNDEEYADRIIQGRTACAV